MNNSFARRLRPGGSIVLFVCDFLPSLFTANYIIQCCRHLDIHVVMVRTPIFVNTNYRSPIPQAYKFWYFDTLRHMFDHSRLSDLSQYRNILPFEVLRNIKNVNLIDVDDINDSQLIQEVSSGDAFLGAVAVRFHQIFSASVVQYIRSKGFFLNIHGGKLPQYRGLMNVFHMAINQEPNISWTVHELLPEVDSGEARCIVSLPLITPCSLLSCELELAKSLFPSLIDTKSDSVLNEPREGKYYSNLRMIELETLYQKQIFVAELTSFRKDVIDEIFDPKSKLNLSAFRTIEDQAASMRMLTSGA